MAADKPHDFNDASKTRIELFSTAKIYLMAEVNRHPKLCEILYNVDPTDWPLQLGEIAAYCLVLMDGLYTDMELEHLYTELNFRLKGMGKVIL